MLEPFASLLLGLFSVTALVLATLGIYSITSYNVAAGMREMAIRMALGARGGDISSMVLRRSLALAVGGIGIGLVAAEGSSHFIVAMLYGAQANDPRVHLAVSTILGLTAAGRGGLSSAPSGRSRTRIGLAGGVDISNGHRATIRRMVKRV